MYKKKNIFTTIFKVILIIFFFVDVQTYDCLDVRVDIPMCIK